MEMTKKTMLTQARLKKVLNYNELTGIFTWKVAKARRIKTGDIAGNLAQQGYSRIVLDGKLYYSHRLAWFYVHGEWPKDQIDHINQSRTDNRIVNLREVTGAENNKNQSLSKSNKSGSIGVYWQKARNKWIAQININGKVKYLGLFSDKEDAIEARQAANIKYNYHVNHGKIILT